MTFGHFRLVHRAFPMTKSKLRQIFAMAGAHVSYQLGVRPILCVRNFSTIPRGLQYYLLMRDSRSTCDDRRRQLTLTAWVCSIFVLCGIAIWPATLAAQTGEAPAVAAPDPNWATGVDVDPPAAQPSTTTVIERAGSTATKSSPPGVKLVALLTADGQQIDQGLVWRVFQGQSGPGKSKLVAENREASPQIKLQPGDYIVNAAFGRANLTRKISVQPSGPVIEEFVLNAGGLRLNALSGGNPAPSGIVSYAIFSDERDQSDSRTAVMTGAKPNLIIRLNAGIYRVVSTYGDANARIETDVTVEAGKLTETTVSHAAGKANFKLVTRAGGEAIPDTEWTIKTVAGEIVKESVGALPSHYLAPGQYTARARSGGQFYTSSFNITDGETTIVEVLRDASAVARPEEPAQQPDINIETEATFDLKNQ
jgi:hypothetical protein